MARSGGVSFPYAGREDDAALGFTHRGDHERVMVGESAP